MELRFLNLQRILTKQNECFQKTVEDRWQRNMLETDFKELVLHLYKKSEANGNTFKKEPLKNNLFNAKPKQKAAFCHFSRSE